MGLFSKPEHPETKVLRQEAERSGREAERAVINWSHMRADVANLRVMVRYSQRQRTEAAAKESLEIQIDPPAPGPAPTSPDVDALVAGPPPPPTR